MRILVACVTMVLNGSLVSAQQRARVDSAGEPHAALRRFVGEWEGQARMWRFGDSTTPPVEGTVIFTADLAMGGRFLVEKLKSMPPLGPYEAVRISGYDNVTHRYQRAVYTSFETGIMQQVGELNPAGVC